MCATKTNAELLGIEQTTGTLIVGKQADLIVLDGNPLDDIRNTQRIVAVWHGGREVQPVGERQSKQWHCSCANGRMLKWSQRWPHED